MFLKFEEKQSCYAQIVTFLQQKKKFNEIQSEKKKTGSTDALPDLSIWTHLAWWNKQVGEGRYAETVHMYRMHGGNVCDVVEICPTPFSIWL